MVNAVIVLLWDTRISVDNLFQLHSDKTIVIIHTTNKTFTTQNKLYLVYTYISNDENVRLGDHTALNQTRSSVHYLQPVGINTAHTR